MQLRLEALSMNTAIGLPCRVLTFVLICFPMATGSVAQVDSPKHLAGPRNTISWAPHTLAKTPIDRANRQKFGGPRSTVPSPRDHQQRNVQISREQRPGCQAQLVHHGSPSKGFDRLESPDPSCDRSR